MNPEEEPANCSAPPVSENISEGAAELGGEDVSTATLQRVDTATGDQPVTPMASQGLVEASAGVPTDNVTIAGANSGAGQDGKEDRPTDTNLDNEEEGEDAKLQGNEADAGKYISGDVRIHISAGIDGIMGVLVRKQNLKRMGLLDNTGSESGLTPFKRFSKKAILQEIGKKGKDSDWTEHKAIIKAYPLEEVLLVRDDAGSYGANFLMPFTEIAFKAVQEAITTANADAATARGEEESKRRQALEMEEKKRLRDENADVPVTPREWQSETADVTAAEIEGMTIKAKRPLVKQTFIKKDSLSVDVKQELDFAVQAVPLMKDAWSQAAGDAMKDVEIQHDANDLIKRGGLSNAASRKSFQAFFSKVAGMIEEALQHNETIDILKDDLSAMKATARSTVQAESEEALKEVFTFTDLSYSKNKLISFVEWIPESEKLIACAAMDAASFDERVEAPSRSSKPVILIWSLENPLVPQQLFAAPYEITTFCFVPASQNRLFLVAGLLNGQVALWDASFIKVQHDTTSEGTPLKQATRCFRPSRDFQLSPFIPRVVLLVTDFAFHIMRLGCPRPVYSSPTPPASYSCGVWSPSRPGVLFLGRTDGHLEVWDLKDQLQKPTTLSAVSAAQLTSLAFPQLQQQKPRLHQHPGAGGRSKSRKFTRQPQVADAMLINSEPSPALVYLAVGDATGALRVLRLFPSLTNPNPDELSHISSMLLKDDGRMDYLNEREAALKKATEEKNKRQAVEKESEEAEVPPEEETENHELEKMEAEYKAMEAAFLKELWEPARRELPGCLSAQWLPIHPKGRGCMQRLCLLDRKGSIKFAQVESDEIFNLEVEGAPLPSDDKVLALAPFTPPQQGGGAPYGCYLASAAADGTLIIWERQGLEQQQQLELHANSSNCSSSFACGGGGVRALLWGGGGLLVAVGEELVVIELNLNYKEEERKKKEKRETNKERGEMLQQHRWKAHAGGVTAADWAPAAAAAAPAAAAAAAAANLLIVSAGWDCRCCLWGAGGLLLRCIGTEQLFTSSRPWLCSKKAAAAAAAQQQQQQQQRRQQQHQQPSAVAWHPAADLFAVATAAAVAICSSKGELISAVPLPQGKINNN
ncbi:hypothtetical protein, conserved, putative [Eimeria brunetti]|uniref:Hypothtetical protein, conserved, putative n=1 Tax=Eimeria brunetti TaxID=51314 RepID=U6LFR3_9EIME|nr:hypothtetical protein, conserved, putative [Eimeria brunetti]